MLYTKKGDKGMTGTFGCDQRVSKSSAIAEALGTLDEINSFLGLCKIKSEKEKFLLPNRVSVAQTVHDIQKTLFVIQAELAGASMSVDQDRIKETEKIIDAIEKKLPPIKKFFISGGCELAVFFDIARTIARRAERRVIEVDDEGKIKISDSTKAYLNRLSSLLYALARLANHKFGIKEKSPDYQ